MTQNLVNVVFHHHLSIYAKKCLKSLSVWRSSVAALIKVVSMTTAKSRYYILHVPSLVRRPHRDRRYLISVSPGIALMQVVNIQETAAASTPTVW